jgi:DUF4097 and DUF4098 domain-containing protein YvlB
MERIQVAAMAFACVWLGGCEFREFESSDRYQSDFHYSYPINAGSRLELENFNGQVDIASWDQSKCDISGVKYASSVSVRDRIKIEVHQSGSTIYIRSVRPSGEIHGNLGVRYSIHVPRKVDLSRIVSTNGAIRVEDTEGRADLKTSNGEVRVVSLTGPLSVQTSNGAITVQNVSGNLSLRTNNAAIRAERVSAGIEATSSNGSINVQFSDTAKATLSPIKFETSNGRIDLTLPVSPRSDIRARTSNGSITLRLPSDASAKVRAVTSHGQVRSDFPPEAASGGKRNRRQSYEGTLGDGGPMIDLHTSNGSIQLLRM